MIHAFNGMTTITISIYTSGGYRLPRLFRKKLSKRTEHTSWSPEVVTTYWSDGFSLTWRGHWFDFDRTRERCVQLTER